MISHRIVLYVKALEHKSHDFKSLKIAENMQTLENSFVVPWDESKNNSYCLKKCCSFAESSNVKCNPNALSMYLAKISRTHTVKLVIYLKIVNDLKIIVYFSCV